MNNECKGVIRHGYMGKHTKRLSHNTFKIGEKSKGLTYSPKAFVNDLLGLIESDLEGALVI